MITNIIIMIITHMQWLNNGKFEYLHIYMIYTKRKKIKIDTKKRSLDNPQTPSHPLTSHPPVQQNVQRNRSIAHDVYTTRSPAIHQLQFEYKNGQYLMVCALSPVPLQCLHRSALSLGQVVRVSSRTRWPPYTSGGSWFLQQNVQQCSTNLLIVLLSVFTQQNRRDGQRTVGDAERPSAALC